MNQQIIIALIVGIILFGDILKMMDQNPMLALIGGVIACFMLYFLWSPPLKHKDFSYHDRLEATSRAMGGSGAPLELPTPVLHEKKHHNKDKE